MSDVVPIKYRAFLSYSHADTGVARRVHARLEAFRIDRDLVGRATPMGEVPATLRPIFRDRNDFDAGATLGDQTLSALDTSAALIVLASPRSAKSHYVNEEVRLFKARHPERPVIPLIVAGKPGDGDNECFAPALRSAVDAAGAVTETLVDVLAADLREQGDGFDLALAKVVARLIGLSPDEVFRRAERERRRRVRVRTAVAAAMVALALIGGGFFWQAHQQGLTLAEIDALVSKYSLVSSAEAAVPGARQSLTQAITAIAEGAATDPRYAKALELLKAGRPAEAEPLLKAVAEDRARRADKDAKDAAAAYRNLASIAAVSDHKRARDYYAEAARLDPSNIWGMVRHGEFQLEAGNLSAAEAAYAHVVELASGGRDEGALYWAQLGLGDIRKHRGDLNAALASYRQAKTIVDRRVAANPGNAGWQRDLSVSYDRVGDVLVAQGNLPEALKSYRDSLAIAEGFATANPGNAGRRRDLSVSYENVGDVLVAQGNLPEALKAYRDSLAIRKGLATADPSNAGWQRDLSESYNKLGDVLVAQGNLPEALKAYRDSLAIGKGLATVDPSNALWQRDLSESYNKLGDVLVAQGNLPEALKAYRDSLAISKRLATADPSNAAWQRDFRGIVGDTGSIAYRLLLARDFATALEAADLALSHAPDQTWIYTNRAHALMFLGRADEAKAIYLQHRGETTQDDKVWETVIRADFAELRQAGLTNPLMDEIETLFAAPR